VQQRWLVLHDLAVYRCSSVSCNLAVDRSLDISVVARNVTACRHHAGHCRVDRCRRDDGHVRSVGADSRCV
jgi:hypothetical protein